MTQQIQVSVGTHRVGQPRRTTSAPAPGWLDPSRLAKALVSAENSTVAPIESTHYDFPEFEVYATNRGPSDLVLQFLEVKIPDFEEFLTEAVDVHFGSADAFALHHDSSLKTYGLLMRGVRSNPAFSTKRYVEEFLELMVRAARLKTGKE